MKIARKLLAHYVDTAVNAATPVYERLGKDLEEYKVSMNANSNDKQNILGETSVVIDSYAPTGSVDPFYAEKDSALYTRLEDIIDNRLVLDDLITHVVDVHLWEETTEGSGVYKAFREKAYFEVKEYGGDTTGFQIPFDLHYTGERESGYFTISTKTFSTTAPTAK